MKKIFILGLLGLAGAAVYFGVVTLRTGNGELSIGFDQDRAGSVVETVKDAADKALDRGAPVAN